MTDEDAPEPAPAFRAGFVAIVGRPNVGKSTLVNQIVGQKVAIVSDKPQTTRNRILAVVNRPTGQVVLFDTPGIHKPMHRMNERMVDSAVKSLGQVDLAVWVVDVTESYGPGDKFVRELLKQSGKKVVLALNKVDSIAKPKILGVIEQYRHLLDFADVVPVSALTGDNVDVLVQQLIAHLPEGAPLYPDDFLTDLPERFFVAEMVREQVLQHTHAELPFATAVVVDKFEEPEREKGLMRLYCTILVERESQKPIIIGRRGEMIKAIGTAAREGLERFFDTKVYLDLHVKVKSEWREDERVLDELFNKPI